ncbi:MAG: transporter substrate-binding domain-containing protein [Treponema sp.]|nr:transporter substrate-binding domain-containing protein [Treponema sp.]
MRAVYKLIRLILSMILLAVLISGCFKSDDNKSAKYIYYKSYREIPGVTDDEIAVIEEIKKQTGEFIYGMITSTEAFSKADGELNGFSELFSRWLTELFGIKFTLRNYTWFNLLEALESGEADFTGDLSANDERRETYLMTGSIAQRSVKYFRIADSPPISEISKTRLPIYILQEKNTVAADILYYSGGTFEPIFIQEYDEAYELLKTGQADALVAESVQEAFWDSYSDITATEFYPLIYSPVSLSTQNSKLAPFISVVQKALENGAVHYLHELYDTGHLEYMKHRLYNKLSDEEINYIKQNPVIRLGAEYDYYPVSYFDERNKKWQGIAFEVLDEISSLSGLEFTVAHSNKTQFFQLLQMLETGDLDMVIELIRSPEREGRYLWPANSVMTERSVLISRVDYRKVSLNRIHSEKIGLNRGTAHSEFFHSWFPNHPNVTEFSSQQDSFDALINGKVDLVMNSYSSLLNLTNYRELPDYKVNIIFNNSFASTFGFNKSRELLCSIIDKALVMIDTESIADHWRNRTYDYRLNVAQARTPWLIGFIALSLLVLSLVAVLFFRSRMAGKELEGLVKKRTYELALQTATLTTLFDSIPDLIFTKSLDLKFLHCNKAFLEHFNKDIDEVVGSTDGIEMGMSDEEADAYKNTDRMVIDEKQTFTIEEYIPHFKGTKPLYETIKMPLMLDGKVVGIMGIARDITKRKEAEAAALAASKSKSTFLANMSHEIRTPMNAILGVTELLLQHDKIPDDIGEGLDKIYSSCDLLLGIINDILDFSKIEAGKLDIMPAQYKVANMINNSVHLNMMRIESKPIAFELKINENIPVKLIGDELRIKQILNNLLSNAFKYTDSGKVLLSVEAERLPEDIKNNQVTIIIQVRDTGHGMTKEQLGKMFEEYSRFVQGTKINVEGTGLGLAITQRLINLMNGKIHVESEPGNGTLFVVRLPQEIVDNEVFGIDAAENLQQFRRNYMKSRKRGQITRDPMPYGKVLVVDDVETNIYVAVGLMKLYGLKIDIAMNGKDAIDKIEEGNIYDVLFMDHMMPEMDGIETAKRIRKLGYLFPIVALTANAVAGQAEMFMRNGFDDFISKPIDIRQLNSVLNRFIRDKQPPEVIEAARRQKEETDGVSSLVQIDSFLLDSFIRDANKAIAWLDEELLKNDFNDEKTLNNFTIVVHGIKSSLWNINEIELADFASRLEKGGREHNIDFISQAVNDFLNQLRSLVKKLMLKRDENEVDGTDEDIEDLCGKLEVIQQKAEDYDRKGVLEMIAKIKNCSKETKAVLDIIMEYILHSEFEEVKKIAADHEMKIRKK